MNQGTRTEDKNFYYLFDKLLAPVDRINHLHETKLRKFWAASIGNKKKNPTQRLETPETSIAWQE